MSKQSKFFLLLILIASVGSILLGLYYYHSQPKTNSLVLSSDQTKEQLVSATLVPQKTKTNVQREFALKVKVDTNQTAVNVFSFKINFPVDTLEFLGFDKKGSIAPIWFEEKVLKNEGRLLITAGVPNPGFKGAGALVSLKFKAKSPGLAEVSFNPKSTAYRQLDNKNVLGLTNNAKVYVAKKL